MDPKLEGKSLPETTYQLRRDGEWHELSRDEFLKGRTVALFGLPGAFTPTCSSSHVPRYEELAGSLTHSGIDEVVCLSVNDRFVMEAWAKHQGVRKVSFLADGNGTISEAIGMLVDKTELGFGKRSWRYSAIIKDGVVTKAFVEPEKPGDPFEASDADTMLAALEGARPADVVLIGREGCRHCVRAKAALDAAGIPYEEIPASPRRLRATCGGTTTPQVFIDGKHIGGADELETYLANQ